MSLTGLGPSDRRRVGMLTHFALDQLWYASPDAAPDGGEEHSPTCCPTCCAPCLVLAELLEAGTLDEWVRGWADDSLDTTAWWDTANQCVDRGWLIRAWSQTDKLACH